MGAGLPLSLQEEAETPGVSGARKDLGHPVGSTWRALSFMLMCVFPPMHPQTVMLEGLVKHIGSIHLSQEGRRCGGHHAQTAS